MKRAARATLTITALFGTTASAESQGRTAFASPTPTMVRSVDSLLAAEFASSPTGGVVLVAHDGKPIVRRAYGKADVTLGVPMRADHVFKVGSITKQFTAVAILQLAAAGKLALGDDVRKHLPGFNTHGRAMTIEQVLTHTSGLPNVVDLPAFDSLARADYTPAQLLNLTRDAPLHFEPGTSFRYSDTGYFVLGAIVERASGMPYAEYVETRIFRAFGMRASYYADDVRVIPNRAAGYSVRDGKLQNPAYMSMTVPYAAGALASTVDDLLTWHLALRGGKVMSDSLLARSWRARVLPNGTSSGYGFGFKTCSLAGRRRVSHGGFINGFGAAALQLPDDRLDIIVLVNNDADAPEAGRTARRVARLLLTGRALPVYAVLTAAQRATLLGRYEIAPGDVRTISERSGVLYVQRNARAALPVEPVDARHLTLGDSEGEYLLSFEFGADGRATMRTSLGCEPVDVATRIQGP